MQLDDRFLIKGLLRQDKSVFDVVFTSYYSGLCAYVTQIIHNRQAAEDIVQDFFVRLWFNPGFLEHTLSLKSYFFSSVKNRATDYLKHEAVKNKYSGKSQTGSEVILPEDLWEFTENEIREAIEQGLRKLPPRAQEIFTLSRFRGLSNEDIAKKFDISKRTVEVQISIALKILRKELKDFLPLFLLIRL
jgi:RNA polymerase sigma-70 factor, ECF subfamily